MPRMDGYLLVDKPAGISSFGAVARIRGIIKAETGQKVKIGHTGTLDPAATGLLILVLGKYTKRASELSKLDKVYDVEATLGVTSTTGDSEGTMTKVSDKRPGLDEVKRVLAAFEGEIMQTPPIYSAMKIGGQRAYKLARAGKEVVLEARKTKVYSIENIDFTYPKLRFTVHVGSGTYIRSLVEDIGTALGTGAYTATLRRVRVGSQDVKDAMTLDNIKYSDIINHVKQIPQ